MPAMAAAGQLVCLLAGPASAIGRVKPYTEGVLSRGNIVVSESDAGMASTLKIIANTLVLSMVEALAEAHTLAEKSGLRPEMLEQVLAITFPGLHQVYSKMMSSGDYYKMEEVSFSPFSFSFSFSYSLSPSRYCLCVADN